MTGNTYLLLKALHILGAVLFLGNIIVTGWWKVMADRTKDPRVVAFAQRQVTLTDFVLTAGGAALLLATGLGNALLHGLDYRQIHWLVWGTGLFVASGVIWVAILIPIQVAQHRMVRAFADGGKIPRRYWSLGRAWIVFGTLATVLPLLNLYWMVFKPT